MRRYPLLGEGEEKALFRRRDGLRLQCADGNKRIILALEQRAVEANLRFVVLIAKEYENDDEALLLELIQEGNCGLIKGVRQFDYSRGYKLVSYAVWWIRQAIMEHLRKSDIVRLPANRVAELRKINRVIRRFTEEGEGRRPEIAEVAKEIQFSEDYIKETLHLERGLKTLSLDAPFNGCSGERDAGRTLGDVLASRDDGNDAILSKVDGAKRHRDVVRLIGLLPEREAKVVCLYFGVGEDRPHTLDEIGERLGLTRERVRQIKGKAIRRLQHPANTKILAPMKEYIED